MFGQQLSWQPSPHQPPLCPQLRRKADVQLALAGGVARNPQGPASSFDPSEPGEKKRVMRGGSFLCTDQYCSRYMVGTRGKGEVSTGTSHLGFRCVKEESRKEVRP
jgi:formylglycine-generating enzyme required for sulfatase activity